MSAPDNLPVSWAVATLGRLGHYRNGRGYRKSEWTSSGIPIVRIQNLTGTSSKFNYFDGPVSPEQTAYPGDLLISWAATLDAYIWRGPLAAVNQHIFKVESYIDPKFHYYALKYALASLHRSAHGSGMVHVTRRVFDETPVPLPPIDEQRRIATALEGYLAELDAAGAALAKLEARLDRLRYAVIARAVGAVESKLKLLSAGWAKVDLGEITDSVRNGVFMSRPGSVPVGVPILRIGSVRQLRLDLADRRWTGLKAQDKKLAPFLLRGGDLLFTRYNGNPEYVGACAAVPALQEALVYPDKLIRVRLDRTRALPAFIAMACGVGAARTYLRNQVKTTAGQAGIAASSLRRVPVLLPPLSEQERRVEAAQRELSIIDDAARAVTFLSERICVLRRSLLHAAFTGRLAAQDPSDEPAELLLKRIAEERAAVKPTARRGRTRAVRRATSPSRPAIEESV